MHNEMTFCTSC